MRILISGYYGFGNAGDELILHSIVSEARSRQPGARICVLSAHPRSTAESYRVEAVQRWDPLRVFFATRACDVFVSGGGGLFQDDTGNKSLYYYLGLIILAKLLRKKVFLYAVGANELRRINKTIAAGILRMADIITVRENYTRELLQSWGCPAAKIEVTSDPVLHKETVPKALDEHHPNIAFILRPPRRGEWHVDTFAKFADALAQRLSARIVFVPFHGSHDLPFTLAVMNEMRSTSRLIQWNHARELFDVFGGIDLVISQRLHGLILASLYGIPLIGISEDPKIARFLHELGQKHVHSLTRDNLYSLLATVSDVWEWREDFRKSVRALLPVFRSRSRRTAELLFSMDSRQSRSPSR